MASHEKTAAPSRHQALPVALLPTAVMFDLVYIWTGRLIWAHTAYWMILAGIVCVLGAAAAETLATLWTGEHAPIRRTAMAAVALHVLTAMIFGLSLALRSADPLRVASTGALLLGIAGVGFEMMSGRLAGDVGERRRSRAGDHRRLSAWGG